MVSLSPAAMAFPTEDDDSAVIRNSAPSEPRPRRACGKTVMRSVAILMNLAFLLIQVPAQAAPDQAKRGASAMTNREAWNIYQKYISAWNTNDVEQRLKIANDVLADTIEYQTARHDWSTGRTLVIQDMATFHEKFPGGHFEIGDVSAHHDVALLTWVIVQADGKVFARGGDQITVDPSGKISKIITFAPSVKDPN
jgi:hypothetical protein